MDTRDGVAVITIDNPPVNALGAAACGVLVDAFAEAHAAAAVQAIVIRGARGTFSAGADIAGFGALDPAAKTTRDVIAAIESGDKPVVAALEGNVLGAGCEVALACDARIASPAARIGLPEIKLGLLPGAGGTQRMPRVVGLTAGIELILSGEFVGAPRAHALGLVDALADGDVVDAAVAHARTLIGAPRSLVRDRTPAGDAAAIDAARAKAEPAARGGLAAQRALDCIAETLTLPIDAALANERDRFLELVGSDQSKARRHIFFAEREAAKVPGVAPSAFKAARAVVIGSGTMGAGIAMTMANAGIAVTLIDVQPELLERARTVIAGNYASTLKKGRLTQAEMDTRLGLIAYATDLATAADVDVVIEAVFEDMDVKTELFAKLDAIAKPGTLLATNTSTLDIDRIAAATRRPQDVIGTHFFSPANVMKLLEIVRGAATSAATIANAVALGKQLKKIPVVVGNCDGFVGNRMLYMYRRQADFLIEEGASPEQVDRALKVHGLAMGPFAMSDLAGLDVGWRIRKRKYPDGPPPGRYAKLADELCERGRFGQKTGAGYFRYEPGDRTPHPDPEVDALIAQIAREAGIAPRSISDDEIVKRCMYPLVNEAALILDEGIATRPGDIDVVYVYGYGYPAWRGGPLQWADTLGLAHVVAEMDAFRAQLGDAWPETAPLLRELAAAGETFGAWKGARAWATR